MLKALCCCLKKPTESKTIQDPLIKTEEIYKDIRSISDIVENKRVGWLTVSETDSKEEYYRMLSEAAMLKQKLNRSNGLNI
jgi:hypothetical protein